MSLRIAAATVVSAPTFALVVGLCAIGGSGSASANGLPDSAVCASSRPVVGLAAAAAANARIVTAVAEDAGGASAAVVAVSVGIAESGLRVLGNIDGQQGDRPVQGIGSDHDSIGIFQQRPSWGSVAQRLDPAASTTLFVARLLTDPGWQTKPPWVAGQDVQVSAYDGTPRAANNFSAVYGGEYAATTAQAQQIVAEIDHDSSATATQCTALTGGHPAGPTSRHGLPVDYTIPADATPAEATVVAFAVAQLDKPYVFAAAGPDAYDCSGLTLAAWAQVGIQLQHWAPAQAAAGTATTAAAMAPGDLVLVPGDDGTLAAPGHVGLAIGYGLVLNASDERDGIRVQTFPDFVQVGHGLSAIRHLA